MKFQKWSKTMVFQNFMRGAISSSSNQIFIVSRTNINAHVVIRMFHRFVISPETSNFRNVFEWTSIHKGSTFIWNISYMICKHLHIKFRNANLPTHRLTDDMYFVVFVFFFLWWWIHASSLVTRAHFKRHLHVFTAIKQRKTWQANVLHSVPFAEEEKCLMSRLAPQGEIWQFYIIYRVQSWLDSMSGWGSDWSHVRSNRPTQT